MSATKNAERALAERAAEVLDRLGKAHERGITDEESKVFAAELKAITASMATIPGYHG